MYYTIDGKIVQEATCLKRSFCLEVWSSELKACDFEIVARNTYT
jgi:hypothetical protein